MQGTTSSEFTDWQEYIRWEASKGFHRADYYLAQIAAEVVKNRLKDPSKVSLKDFMIPFSFKSDHTPEANATEMSEDERKSRIAQVSAWAKAKWGAFTRAKIPKEET
jgi:hypothetical protein